MLASKESEIFQRRLPVAGNNIHTDTQTRHTMNDDDDLGMSSSYGSVCVCVTIGLGSGNKLMLLLLLDTLPQGENALDRKLHAIREAIVVVESERFIED